MVISNRGRVSLLIARLSRGVGYGALAGLIASEVFIVSLTVASAVSGDATPLALLGLGQLFGALPAAIVGSACGLLISTAITALGSRLDTHHSWVVGAVIAVAIVIAAVAFTVSRNSSIDFLSALLVDFGQVLGFVMFIALFVGSGAWVGHKLAHR